MMSQTEDFLRPIVVMIEREVKTGKLVLAHPDTSINKYIWFVRSNFSLTELEALLESLREAVSFSDFDYGAIELTNNEIRNYVVRLHELLTGPEQYELIRAAARANTAYYKQKEEAEPHIRQLHFIVAQLQAITDADSFAGFSSTVLGAFQEKFSPAELSQFADALAYIQGKPEFRFNRHFKGEFPDLALTDEELLRCMKILHPQFSRFALGASRDTAASESAELPDMLLLFLFRCPLNEDPRAFAKISDQEIQTIVGSFDENEQAQILPALDWAYTHSDYEFSSLPYVSDFPDSEIRDFLLRARALLH